MHVSIQLSFLFLLLVEQDEGLEALSGIIQRQKLMGQAISDEVDLHNGQCHSEFAFTPKSCIYTHITSVGYANTHSCLILPHC